MLGSRWKETQKRVESMLVLRHYHHNVQYYVSHSPLTLVPNTKDFIFYYSIKICFIIQLKKLRKFSFQIPIASMKMLIRHWAASTGTQRFALVHAIIKARNLNEIYQTNNFTKESFFLHLAIPSHTILLLVFPLALHLYHDIHKKIIIIIE